MTRGAPLTGALLEGLAGEIAAEIEAKVESGEAIDPDLVKIPAHERRAAAMDALVKVVGGEKALLAAERNNARADELLKQAQLRVQHRVAEAIYVGLLTRHLEIMRPGADGWPRYQMDDLTTDIDWIAQVARNAAAIWVYYGEEGE